MVETEGTGYDSQATGDRAHAMPRSDETARGTRPARRPRYRGLHPRRFEEKYKEHRPDLYPETVEKVIRSGKTPAGMHRPIMVEEVLEALALKPGMVGADCTLGYGGHAQAILKCILPGGKLIGLDADPLQIGKTEARLRSEGFGPSEFVAINSNFAALPKALSASGPLDFILADLGVSSMQLDDPTRGFSYKQNGPLDMRMNPEKSRSAADLLGTIAEEDLAKILRENADEPHASALAHGLAGRDLPTTASLSAAIERIVRGSIAQREEAKRRVFQALRIEVNAEFQALDALLRAVAWCLKPGGRAVFLTFHSGEDRRVKQSFREGRRDGIYSEVATEVQRPSSDELHSNPRAKSAKLRWAIRAGAIGEE
jgi:16S rRNA (cytosine1402-N4)-methyltransferase